MGDESQSSKREEASTVSSVDGTRRTDLSNVSEKYLFSRFPFILHKWCGVQSGDYETTSHSFMVFPKLYSLSLWRVASLIWSSLEDHLRQIVWFWTGHR